MAVERVVFIHEIAYKECHSPGMKIVGDGDAHRALFVTIFPDCSTCQIADFLKRAVVLVVVEKVRAAIIG